MSAHRFAFTAAAGALAFSAPALAQPAEPYEYAQEAGEPGIVYDDAPMVQPVPLPLPVAAPPHGHHPMGAHHPAPPPAYPAYGHAMPPMAHPRVPPFDRDAWLRNCRERIRGVSREERGSVIGGLLGAAAGGVIGNRAFDSERLGGTLLGAGIGGLAGLAVGAAIGAAGDRRREDECAWHLDRYMAGGHAGYGYGYPQAGHGYGYGYGYGYPAVAYVPVLVAVPQRAVVRETVTEEWVDVPVPSRSVPRRAPVHHAAPAPDKRVKLIKGR
ncbi:MAG: hypothetical protein ACEQR8_07335 [Cypionkella sp.]